MADRTTRTRRASRGLLRRWLIALIAAATLATPAMAGPPYVTDDPEPAETGHWEIYGFVAGAHASGEISGDAGLDINYGVARDLQLTLVLPLDWDDRGRRHAAPANVELGVKYLFIHAKEHTAVPDVAFFPSFELPTGSPRMGGGAASLLLPLWAQKDLGRWSLFGGGGYALNRGRGRRDSWLAGGAAVYALTGGTQLGAELFRETGADRGERPTWTANIGITRELGRHWALLAAGGPAWCAGRRQTGFYLALEFRV